MTLSSVWFVLPHGYGLEGKNNLLNISELMYTNMTYQFVLYNM